MKSPFTVEDELRLAHELALSIGEANGEHQALEVALARICRATGWQLGQVWTPEADHLRCGTAWYCDESMREQLLPFHTFNEQLLLPPGVSLPGLVWQSRKSTWVQSHDVANDSRFARAQQAFEAGLQVALAVPVAAGNEIVAVLEFFAFETQEEDEHLLRLVSVGALQLGSLLLRKRAEEALRESDAEWKALLRAIDDLVLVLDGEARYVKIAPTNNQLLYRPPEEMLGKTVWDVFPSHIAERFAGAVRHALQSGCTSHIEYSLPVGEQVLWFSANISRMSENRVVWVARDITERKTAEVALKRAEEKYRGLFENALEGIFQTDLQGRYLSANPALARIYGYDSPQQLMTDLTDIAHQLYVDPERRNDFARLLARHGQLSSFESQVRRRDGTSIWISENARAILGPDNQLLGYEGTVEDITERKRQETQFEQQQFRLQEINLQLQALATLDGLTGLKNHRALQDALRQECERALRERHPLSFLLLDVDRFKDYNDSCGHPAGDAVLQQFAHVLGDNARDTDFVARYGGEEFAIVLPRTNAENAVHSAERFRQSIEGTSWPTRRVTASFGVATFDPDKTPFDESETNVKDKETRCTELIIKLITEADQALYWSKSSGRNCTTHVDDLPK
ncbi:MAG TPA: diguanylate cyclase [Abditibacteriaceae bacterium]|nr:diguanylate cyclase [Abditibacteriaceae bacterium]